MARELITEQHDGYKQLGKGFERIVESYSGFAMSAADHRAKADQHDARADELVSGEKRDAYTIAARNHRKAADAIDKANQSSAKADCLD